MIFIYMVRSHVDIALHRPSPCRVGSNKLGRNKFRSVNEFIPHAMWLAKNDPTVACECKYCSGKKKQTEISPRRSTRPSPKLKIWQR